PCHAPDGDAGSAGLQQCAAGLVDGGAGGHHVIDRGQVTSGETRWVTAGESVAQVALPGAGIQALLGSGGASAQQIAIIQRDIQGAGDGPGQLHRLVEAPARLAAAVQRQRNHRIRQLQLPVLVVVDYRLLQQSGQQTAPGQAVLVLECRYETVDRETVAQRCYHLTEQRWLLLALSAQQALGAQRQSALTTGRSQPGQIVQAGRANAIGGSGGTAEAKQAAVALINIYPLVNQ